MRAQILHRPALRQEGEQILHQHDADDRVGLAVLHRQARAARLAQLPAQLLDVIREVDELHLAPRRHQGAGGAIGQAHDAGDHLALVALQHAGRLRFGDDGAHLLLGDPLLRFALLTEQREHGLAREIEQEHQRRADPGEQRHRRRDAGSDALGIAQRDLLGHQLAEDQREVGDGDDDDADAQRIRCRLREAVRAEPFRQARAERGTRKRAREHADERDADLHGGEKAAGVFRKAHGCRRASVALIAENLEPSRPRGDDGEFRHGKQTVDDGQHHDDQDFG